MGLLTGLSFRRRYSLIATSYSRNKEYSFASQSFLDHLLHSVAFRIPNRLILLDKSPDTVAIWDYEKPN